MFVIIWEFHVKAEHVAEFEHMYSADGAWANLFKNAEGFQGTDLLRDPSHRRRYMTIDRWDSSEHYERFLSQWKLGYDALDAQCARLTEKESLFGKWESIPSETQ